jgi:hypothetical protein
LLGSDRGLLGRRADGLSGHTEASSPTLAVRMKKRCMGKRDGP